VHDVVVGEVFAECYYMIQTMMPKQPRQSTIIINNYSCGPIGSKALVST